MHLSRTDDQSLLLLELTDIELSTLKACLRESFAFLAREDFPLRIGINLEQANEFASELNALMRDVGIED